MISVTLVNAVSAATTITSNPIDLGDMKEFSVEAVFSGSNLAGTMVLQGSNTTNFITITNSSVTITAADDILFVVTNGLYRYVKAVWTPTSGTGNLTATVVIKEPVVRMRGL